MAIWICTGLVIIPAIFVNMGNREWQNCASVIVVHVRKGHTREKKTNLLLVGESFLGFGCRSRCHGGYSSAPKAMSKRPKGGKF